MPETSYDLLMVYVDGETKTGKGAAGKHMADVLQGQGLNVYYDVAGDFYRRFVSWVRIELGLTDEDPLPTGSILYEAALKLYKNGKAFERNDELLGNLQRAAIGESVSKLGELPIVQKAGIDWWAKSLELAMHDGAEVVVLDGRNPRLKVAEANNRIHARIRIALDLYMTCEPEVAATRILISRGFENPTKEQLTTVTQEVVLRREQDRNRPVHPFIVPKDSITFKPLSMSAEDAVYASWVTRNNKELPSAIKLDNSTLAMEDMLSAVAGLAVEAVHYVTKNI